MGFLYRILPDIVSADVAGKRFSFCGNQRSLPCLVELKAMEGTLDAISLYLPKAERGTAMGALVHDTAELTLAVPEQGQLQVHPLHADNLPILQPMQALGSMPPVVSSGDSSSILGLTPHAL